MRKFLVVGWLAMFGSTLSPRITHDRQVLTVDSRDLLRLFWLPAWRTCIRIDSGTRIVEIRRRRWWRNQAIRVPFAGIDSISIEYRVIPMMGSGLANTTEVFSIMLRRTGGERDVVARVIGSRGTGLDLHDQHPTLLGTQERDAVGLAREFAERTGARLVGPPFSPAIGVESIIDRMRRSSR